MSAHHTEPKPRSIKPIFLLGVLMLVIFYLLSRFLLSSNPSPDLEAERAALRAKNLEELRADNAKKLDHYAWADKAAGTVRIPIATAKELVLPALNQNKPHAAGPIAPAVPAAAPASSAAPAASPAAAQPSPTPSAS